jgi:hypothetical protein
MAGQSQALPRTLQAPPDLPSDPSITPQLSGYLRSFALWCRHGFADKISGSTAQPGILVQAINAATGAPTPFIYLVGVHVTVTGNTPSAPAVTFTLQPLGSGKP